MEAKRSWRQQIKQHPVASILIAFFIVLGVLVLVGGYIFNWAWTGFNGGKVTYKTLYDWLQLLIIPAVLAVAGYAINLAISRGEQAATEQRAKSEREAAEKRATTEREIAQDNQREAALQKYIDNMSELLLKEHLGELTPEGELKPENKLVRNVARVQTISILTQLDGRRISRVFAFLREAELMSMTSNNNVVSLKNANLRGVNWSQAFIYGANLSKAFLSEADLSYSVLVDCNLCEALLGRTNLSHALLDGADLRGANVTKEQLDKAKSLEGAIMPEWENA